MSKKESIEKRVKALNEREEQIKRQLDSDSDEMKERVTRIGKIALVVGLVSLIGYWVFGGLFGDDDEEEEVEKRPRKRSKSTRENEGVGSMITAFILPYVQKIIDGAFDEDEEESKEDPDAGSKD